MEIDEDLLSCYFCGGRSVGKMFCSAICERAAEEIAQLTDRVRQLMAELDSERALHCL